MSAPWWEGVVPPRIVEAFDSCATTGIGPSQDLADAAYREVRAIAESIEAEFDWGGAECALATFVRDRIGWALPSGEALDAIAAMDAGRRAIEIGGGSGYVAACLRARGLDVATVVARRCSWLGNGWWGRRYVDDPIEGCASELGYDADTYLMLMPDEWGGGVDMMSEALFRMPVGSRLHLYAPRSCSGSERGHRMAAAHFVEEGRLPMLDLFPFEDGARNAPLRVLRKVSQPAEVGPWVRRPSFRELARLESA